MKQSPDISRLPKWAQEYIRDLQRERDVVIRTMREFEDSQTQSRISYEDLVCSGEQTGPSPVRRYVQSRSIVFHVGEQEVRVGFNNHGTLYVNADHGLFFVPEAHNSIHVFPEERVIYAREK